MDDQRMSAGRPVRATTVRTGTQRVSTPVFDVAFINHLFELIEPHPDTTREFVENNVELVSRSYLSLKAMFAGLRTPKESRIRLKRLDRPLKAIADTIGQLSWDYRLTLDTFLAEQNREPDAVGSLHAAEVMLRRLQAAVQHTLDAHKPRGGATVERALELLVGSLMALFEIASGKRATASRTKQGEYVPRATSPQADAIVQIVTSLDPDVAPVRVISKINEIGRKHKGKTLDQFQVHLWMLNQPVTPIPAKREA